jgi:hypothetical protein
MRTRTREQERIRKAQYRERKRAESVADATILEMPTPQPVTTVQDAVQTELASLPAAVTHAGSAAAALAMARILDDATTKAHHAAAARVLADVLQRLHGKGGATGGRLAVLRQTRRDE